LKVVVVVMKGMVQSRPFFYFQTKAHLIADNSCMWITVLGPSGSGKNYIYEALKKDGFELFTFDVKSDEPFERQVEYLMGRFKTHMLASQVKDRKDVVTIRTFHDTHAIISQVLNRLTVLNDREMRLLDSIYQAISGFYIAPPDVVIYMRTEKMSAINRQKLKHVDVPEEFFNMEIDLYADFITRIGVPVIEIDASQKTEVVLKNLEFGINSIKAANLGSQTVWKKEFLR
jgi:dephospho-CoA kinase